MEISNFYKAHHRQSVNFEELRKGPLSLLIDELIPRLKSDCFFSNETQSLVLNHVAKVKRDLIAQNQYLDTLYS